MKFSRFKKSSLNLNNAAKYIAILEHSKKISLKNKQKKLISSSSNLFFSDSNIFSCMFVTPDSFLFYMKKNRVYFDFYGFLPNEICQFKVLKSKLGFIYGNFEKIVSLVTLGKVSCFYLHGMGYKCVNAQNTLFFSIGHYHWDGYSLPKGGLCYSRSRKKSWRKFVIKKSVDFCKSKISPVKIDFSQRKGRKRRKKRKLRTKIKLIRNFHGIIFIWSFLNHLSDKIGWKIRSLHIPNVYTGKGIHKIEDSYKPQERKLKSFYYKR